MSPTVVRWLVGWGAVIGSRAASKYFADAAGWAAIMAIRGALGDLAPTGVAGAKACNVWATHGTGMRSIAAFT